MADYALTKISSKGQIVIPTELRNDIEIGEKLGNDLYSHYLNNA